MNVVKIYFRTIPFVSALTLGYDLQKTTKWSYIEKTWEFAEDLTLTLIWPITAPVAIKNFINRLDLPPYD